MREFVNRLWNEPATARKFIVALLAAITIAVGNGVLPEQVSNWVEIVTPFLAAAGVYRIYNKEEKP